MTSNKDQMVTREDFTTKEPSCLVKRSLGRYKTREGRHDHPSTKSPEREDGQRERMPSTSRKNNPISAGGG